MAYTYAVLEVTKEIFDEIKRKLKEAGYDHLLIPVADGGELIKMEGLALKIGG